jgi:SAM-dependent methyltransferase
LSLRYHELAEAEHLILNPFTEVQLMLLGEVCRLSQGQRILDLACGKGELLCRWAERFGVGGLGIDISEVFLSAARQRSIQLGVEQHVKFEHGDAGAAEFEEEAFDVVSCIGATWIGDGLPGTLRLMRPALRGRGLLLIGEPFWLAQPPPEAYAALHVRPDEFTSLLGTCERLAEGGADLVEMVLADQASWDRYVAAQWWTMDQWLRANPNENEAGEMRRLTMEARRTHLEFGRAYLGWGVFVCRPQISRRSVD